MESENNIILEKMGILPKQKEKKVKKSFDLTPDAAEVLSSYRGIFKNEGEFISAALKFFAINFEKNRKKTEK